MKFTLFALVGAASADYIVENVSPWYDGDVFGQVDSEQVDFNEMFDDSADFLVQVSEDNRQSLGDLLLQVKSMSDDFFSTMQPETAQMFDTAYAQTRESGFNVLAQMAEPERARIGEMLSQTSYGNYFMQSCIPSVADEVTNFFAQQTWSGEAPAEADEGFAQTENESEVADEELEEFAEVLAQLSTEQMQKVQSLAETKRENMGYNNDDEDF